MERKNDPKTLRHDSKEEIVDKAKKGVFDSNPLLATSHVLVCKTCGYKTENHLSFLFEVWTV